jgi:hypothetical protein
MSVVIHHGKVAPGALVDATVPWRRTVMVGCGGWGGDHRRARSRVAEPFWLPRLRSIALRELRRSVVLFRSRRWVSRVCWVCLSSASSNRRCSLW